MKTKEQNQLENLGHKLENRNGELYYSGYLYLRDTCITSLPDNLTVGGNLYLFGTGITDISKVNRNAPTFHTWRNRKYIKADGIFSIVVSCKGNVYKIRQIGKTEERFLITDGNGKWSHGDTLKAAKEDLNYKIQSK